MGTYTVHARKWDGGWELRIVGAGVTWAPDLAHAGPVARAFVGDPSARVEVVPTVGGEADRLILRARHRVDTADEARRGAADAVAEAVRALDGAGVDENDTARLLGLTRARVRELAAEAPDREGPAVRRVRPSRRNPAHRAQANGADGAEGAEGADGRIPGPRTEAASDAPGGSGRTDGPA
ncbi:hypothetical protein O4J56_10270 [Nocardiopsis sp. RSe5-2]|uniref:Uncharacterized protein n=1 Tax=Nocardiopsis endophytica TaxID=3018445 RepID=A0ABT4U255_9ACTN|nr:hypothetical protein [Nocardiopsis endophytica]MDA2811021.1 hypothetical protein [Nocardiopsis endophytica]